MEADLTLQVDHETLRRYKMRVRQTGLSSVARARLREVAGTFATGVTIITTGIGADAHGCTANAVTSLSLEPPLMLVCLDHGASTHPRVLDAGRFVINILRSGPDSERICRLFAGKEEEKFRDIAYTPGVTGLPVLATALSWLECELDSTYEGGDHTIFIGRVVAAEIAGGDPNPLIFYRGRLGQLGEPWEPPAPAPASAPASAPAP